MHSSTKFLFVHDVGEILYLLANRLYIHVYEVLFVLDQRYQFKFKAKKQVGVRELYNVQSVKVSGYSFACFRARLIWIF